MPDLQDARSDYRIARISVPLLGEKFIQLKGAVRFFSPSEVGIRVPPGGLNIREVDPAGEWLLTLTQGGSALSLRAGGKDFCEEEGEVRLQLFEAVTHACERRYPRVDDVKVGLRCWPEPQESGAYPHEFRREVNISAGGIRFACPSRFRLGQKIGMEISLPGLEDEETIRILGCVVRLGAETEEGRETALNFLKIAPHDQDHLLVFSLKESFRHLQTNIRVLAAAVSPSLERIEESTSVSDGEGRT